MDLSIVILNYKTAGLAKTCLRGIKKHPLNLDYEIIVVDNDSNDGIEEMLTEHHPETTFIQAGKNLGHCAGNNLGLKIAKGRNILVLNTDIAILDNSIEKMVQYLDKNNSIGGIGCKLIAPDRSINRSCWRFHKLPTPVYIRTFFGKLPFAKKHLDHFLMKDFTCDYNSPVDWVQSSCFMIKKPVMDEIGMMDERFFVYFGDVDWCRRIWRGGYQVHYYADATIIHYHHQESSGGFGALLKKTTRIHVMDWFRYLKKYGIEINNVDEQSPILNKFKA